MARQSRGFIQDSVWTRWRNARSEKQRIKRLRPQSVKDRVRGRRIRWSIAIGAAMVGVGIAWYASGQEVTKSAHIGAVGVMQRNVAVPLARAKPMRLQA